MSSTDVAHVQPTAPVHQGPTQQRLARMHAEAVVMARSSFLSEAIRGKKNKPRSVEDITNDVMAIALTAEGFGIPVNLTTINQFAVIGGQAVPSTQLLCGVAERNYGHDVWVEEATLDQATACMIHRQTGREHRVTYTLADAVASGALDFTVDHWVDNKCVETLVLGRSAEEAKSALATAPPWAQATRLKFNPAWHNYRADMLAWRAVRRVLKRGAPSVVAGLPADEELYATAITTTAEQIPALVPGRAAREEDGPQAVLEAGEAREPAAASAPPPRPEPVVPGPLGHVDPPPMPPEAESAEELEAFAHRRRHANAAMGKVGITSHDARHSWVKAATDGRTESTARLTQADLDAIVAACDRLAEEDPGPVEP